MARGPLSQIPPQKVKKAKKYTGIDTLLIVPEVEIVLGK